MSLKDMSDMNYVLERWDKTAPDIQRQVVYGLVKEVCELKIRIRQLSSDYSKAVSLASELETRIRREGILA